MSGPQVPNVVDNEKSDSEEQSKVNENSTKKIEKKILSVCKLCHQKGHKRQYLGKCLLSTNITSMYYRPENVGSQYKLCTGGFV
jgi:hypothetical protein